jgi:hypothetical protein
MLFNFSSPSFFTTSLLPFPLLPATQFRSSHIFFLYSSFLPSIPSLFFSSAVRVCRQHPNFFLTFFCIAVCKCIFCLFCCFILYSSFLSCYYIHSFIASLLYGVISRQHIICAMYITTIAPAPITAQHHINCFH